MPFCPAANQLMPRTSSRGLMALGMDGGTQNPSTGEVGAANDRLSLGGAVEAGLGGIPEAAEGAGGSGEGSSADERDNGGLAAQMSKSMGANLLRRLTAPFRGKAHAGSVDVRPQAEGATSEGDRQPGVGALTERQASRASRKSRRRVPRASEDVARELRGSAGQGTSAGEASAAEAGEAGSVGTAMSMVGSAGPGMRTQDSGGKSRRRSKLSVVTGAGERLSERREGSERAKLRGGVSRGPSWLTNVLRSDLADEAEGRGTVSKRRSGRDMAVVNLHAQTPEEVKEVRGALTRAQGGRDGHGHHAVQ